MTINLATTAQTVLPDKKLRRACEEAFRYDPKVSGNFNVDSFIVRLIARLTELGIRRGAFRKAEALSATTKDGRTLAITASVSKDSDSETLRRVRFTCDLEIVNDEKRARPLGLGFKQVVSPQSEIETITDWKRAQKQDPRRMMGDDGN